MFVYILKTELEVILFDLNIGGVRGDEEKCDTGGRDTLEVSQGCLTQEVSQGVIEGMSKLHILPSLSHS